MFFSLFLGLNLCYTPAGDFSHVPYYNYMKHRILFLQILNKCCLLFYICRRSPISIAAAVIYIVTQLSNEKKALKGQKIVIHISLWLSIGNIKCPVTADISLATRVAEGTIKNSFKDLYPHISRLIPSWFAKEGDLKNLCRS